MLKTLSLLRKQDTIQSRLDNLQWTSILQMPKVNDAIFIDIETDLGGNEVWMIGLLYRGEVTQFTALTKNEEKKILSQFADFLQAVPYRPLVCYSRTNFDFRVLWNAAKRTKHRKLMETMSKRAWLDFCTMLGRSFGSAGGSLALKHVATFFGYQLKQGDYDGLRLSNEYYRRLRRNGQISKYFLNIAEEYNEDDVRIMPYLLKLFGKNVRYTREFSMGYSSVFVRKIRKLAKKEDLSYDLRRDENGKVKLVRLNLDKHYLGAVYPRILTAGLPLPSMHEGRNTLSFSWKSQLARERAADVIPDIFK